MGLLNRLLRDNDGNGIPDILEVDRNRDGIPDVYQRGLRGKAVASAAFGSGNIYMNHNQPYGGYPPPHHGYGGGYGHPPPGPYPHGRGGYYPPGPPPGGYNYPPPPSGYYPPPSGGYGYPPQPFGRY